MDLTNSWTHEDCEEIRRRVELLCQAEEKLAEAKLGASMARVAISDYMRSECAYAPKENCRIVLSFDEGFIIIENNNKGLNITQFTADDVFTGGCHMFGTSV